MFLKLNYTTGNAKWLYQILRIVNECINNTAITSIATLQSTATSGSWDSSLLSGLDATNSTIVRTAGLSTSNTKSHIYGAPATGTTGGVKFTVEFSVHDSLTTKFYNQIRTSSQSVNSAGSGYGIDTIMGTSITGGTISSSGIGVTVANGTTTLTGTSLTLGGYTTSSFNNVSNAQAGPANSIYTAWFYVSDTCFIYAFNTLAANTSGFITPTATTGTANNYGIVTTYYGPIVMGQYNRYDDWNLQSNNIYPVVYQGNSSTTYCVNGLTAACGITTYLTNQYQTGALFYLLTGPTVSSGTITPSTNTMNQSVNQQTIVITAGVPAGFTFNGRPTSHLLAASSNQTTTSVTASYTQMVWTGATYIGYKFPNSTLTAATFSHFPVGWENHYYGMMGGGISEKSGFYYFNGDFSGGDEYTLNGVTYSIWYMYDQVTNLRIGISVPKQ